MMVKKEDIGGWQLQHVWTKEKILQRATNMLPPYPADIKEGAEGAPVGGAVIRYKEKNASGGPENIEEGKIADKRDIADAGDRKLQTVKGRNNGT